LQVLAKYNSETLFSK